MNVGFLKGFSVKNSDLDDLIGTRADLKVLAQHFDDLALPIPDWVTDKLKATEDEIKDRVKAERQATLKKLMSRREALLTRDEKRGKLDEEIANLTKMLE